MSTDETSTFIRVMIVHDHRLLAEGLRTGFESEFDLEVLGMADGVIEAERLASNGADVALIEVELATEHGLDVGEHLKREFPSLKTLLLTGNAEPARFSRRAFEVGFDGFLHRQASIFEAVHAVRTVFDGGAVFAPQDLSRALQQARDQTGRGLTDLTEREIQILQLLAEGTSTAKMAAELYVSPHTVRTHVRHILAKLDSHSKLEAVTAGYRLGLLEPPWTLN